MRGGGGVDVPDEKAQPGGREGARVALSSGRNHPAISRIESTRVNGSNRETFPNCLPFDTVAAKLARQGFNFWTICLYGAVCRLNWIERSEKEPEFVPFAIRVFFLFPRVCMCVLDLSSFLSCV